MKTNTDQCKSESVFESYWFLQKTLTWLLLILRKHYVLQLLNSWWRKALSTPEELDNLSRGNPYLGEDQDTLACDLGPLWLLHCKDLVLNIYFSPFFTSIILEIHRIIIIIFLHLYSQTQDFNQDLLTVDATVIRMYFAETKKVPNAA